MTHEAFEGIFYSLRKNKDGMVISFVVHPSNIPEELVLADIGQRCIVSFVPYVESGPVRAEMKGGLQAPALPPAGQAQGPKSEGERALIRCVLRCKEARFQDWVTMHALYKDGQSIADFVRARCGMVSRSEIAKNDAVMRRWLQLETKYLQDTDQMAEQRG